MKPKDEYPQKTPGIPAAISAGEGTASNNINLSLAWGTTQEGKARQSSLRIFKNEMKRSYGLGMVAHACKPSVKEELRFETNLDHVNVEQQHHLKSQH